MTNSPTGSRLDSDVVGVHERANFCERSEGKDVEGSLEGKASRDHDPIGMGKGALFR